jgi:hypothetical protein
MNGAITEPWVAISSAPNNAMVIIIGASQNFLRTRKKAQNSPIKLPIGFLSELLPHARTPARRRLTIYPIRGYSPIGLQAQWSLADYTHNKRHWGNQKKEQESQDDGIDHPRHCGASAQPESVKRRQAGGCNDPDQKQYSAHNEDQARDREDRSRHQCFCCSDHDQNDADCAPERSIAPRFDPLVVAIILVQRRIVAH